MLPDKQSGILKNRIAVITSWDKKETTKSFPSDYSWIQCKIICRQSVNHSFMICSNLSEFECQDCVFKSGSQ